MRNAIEQTVALYRRRVITSLELFGTLVEKSSQVGVGETMGELPPDLRANFLEWVSHELAGDLDPNCMKELIKIHEWEQGQARM